MVTLDLRSYPLITVIYPWGFNGNPHFKQIIGKALWSKVRTHSSGMRILTLELGRNRFYKLLLPSLTRALYKVAFLSNEKITVYEPEDRFITEDEIYADILSTQHSKNVIELPADEINKYSKNFPLYPHQIFGVNAILNRMGYGLFFEMRTGKTLTTLIGLSILKKAGIIDSVFVVAPMSAYEAWKRDVENNLNAPFPVRIIRLESGKKPKLKLWEKVDDELRIFVTHYEFLRTKAYREYFKPFVQDKWRELKMALVLDESHRVKNPSSKRFNSLIEIAPLFKRYYLLSGTPIGNSIEDIWSQSVFLGLQYHLGNNISQFRRTYMIKHPAGFGFLPARGAVPKIKNVLKEVSIFVRQKDVFDKLKVYKENYKYDLTKEQRDVYKTLAEELMLLISNKEISVAEGIAQSIKLAQVCSGFVADEWNFEELDHSNRDKVLLDLIEDVDRLLIWHEFNHDIRILRGIFSKLNNRKVFVISGDTPKTHRADIINEWRDTPKAVLISKPSILGEGVDLSIADVAVYWNHNYSYIKRFQSESRVISPKKPVAVLWSLFAPKTVEQSILQVIAKGKSVDDEIKENNFYSFISGEL